jgi:DNA-binding IclR family transcriptional regulator
MNSQLKSLAKGLLVYKYILKYDKPILAATLCKNLDIEKSSMSRILKTLKQEYFIDYLENSNKIIALDIMESTHKKTKIELLVKKTHTLLEEIFKVSNECTYLAIFDNYKVLYINQIDYSNREIQVRNSIGLQVPAHSNALGKSMLAFGNYNIEKIKLNQYTENTITQIKGLKNEFEDISKRGYSIDDTEYQDSMRCVAVPLFNSENILVGAVGISGNISRLSLERVHELGSKISDIVAKNNIVC